MSQERPSEQNSNSEKGLESSKRPDGKLDKAPDAKVARNAPGSTLEEARAANPDKHSGSAGGNADDGSFTLVALDGDNVSVVASRISGGSEKSPAKIKLISEQDLLARSAGGDATANLLLRELEEVRQKNLPDEMTAKEINKILTKASRIYPVDRVEVLPSSLNDTPARERERETLNAEPPPGAVKDYRRDTTTGLDKPSHLTPQQVALQKRFGINIIMNGDQAEYHIRANGRNVLFSLPMKDVVDAEKRLSKMVREQENKLTNVYGVTFSADGDTAGPILDAQLRPTGEVAHCRAPRLDELIGIEAGLAHSQPSQYSRHGRALEFVFIKQGDHHIKGRPIGANYEYGEPPKVFMDPTTDVNVATQLDKTASWQRSTEYQVIHELTHGAQERIGWKAKVAGSSETLEDMFARTAGWFKSSGGEFYLRGKSGEFYKCDKLDSTKWKKYDKNLQEAGSVTSEQVRENALITPPTTYMQNPKEEMAECLTAYRLGGSYRNDVNTNAGLYELIQRIDQGDINAGYPPDAHGNPHYLRRDDGQLVLNPDYVAPKKGV